MSDEADAPLAAQHQWPLAVLPLVSPMQGQ